jgi:predicted nucleic acid-binding protein
MRTSLDTNILSALWSNEPGAASIAKRLGEAKQAGAILVSGVVYAELLAYPKATEDFVNDFFEQTGILMDLRFQDTVWLEAGQRFARYANRRRKAKGEGPRRWLADFLVGAHALLQADRLMTLDPGRYRLDFPELRL